MKKNLVTFLFLTILILIGVFNVYGQTKKPLVIGSILPFTGIYSAEGLNMKRGMELALEEVNASGGVLERPLNIVFEDTGFEPQIGQAFARKLIDEKKVPIILGCLSSAVNYVTGGGYQ